MKKLLLSMLVLLCGMGGLRAQVVTPAEATDIDNLTSGWYQIQYVGPGWVSTEYNKFFKTVNISDGVSHNGDLYDLQTTSDQTALNTLVFIDNTGESGTTKDAIATKNTTFTLATGNGVGKGGSRTNFATNKVGITSPDTDKTALGFYFTISSNYGDVFTKGSVYPLGAGAGQKNVRFHLYKINVEANYDVYTVQYESGITATPKVTYSKAGYTGVTEMVNGGVVFVAKGETPLSSEFTSENAGSFQTEVVVDASAKTLTVVRKADEATYNALVAKAEVAYAKTGVGYPVGDARTTFAAAIAAAKAGSPTVAKQEALEAALNAYYVSPEIQMPEDGKVYTFTFVSKTGVKHYINQPESGNLAIVTTMPSKLPATARFIAHKEGDKYVFVNANGNYLQSITSSAGTGQSALYASATCEASVSSLETYVPDTQVKINAVNGRTIENVFGLMYIRFLGRVGATSTPCTLIDQLSNGTFNTTDSPFFNDSFTSGILIEEVNAPLHNSITFKADSKGTGNYATFYNYYPTAVPAGATAYTASNSATAGYITLNELAEGIIPAQTAVVLKSETLTSATLHTGLQTADIDVSTNILQGTLIDDFNPGNIYVLSGTAADGVGFYKLKDYEDIPAFRAYYSSTSSAPAFFFGNGPTTAVELNAATATAEGKAFDLSGREVNKAARGLYIINGKKVVK
ncbi:MAG: hypothetical protein HUK01_01405 [Bacteroidaceae bacterium]|nr:hypothetical protein [Bacteroidaceae bacterium]